MATELILLLEQLKPALSEQNQTSASNSIDKIISIFNRIENDIETGSSKSEICSTRNRLNFELLLVDLAISEIFGAQCSTLAFMRLAVDQPVFKEERKKLLEFYTKVMRNFPTKVSPYSSEILTVKFTK